MFKCMGKNLANKNEAMQKLENPVDVLFPLDLDCAMIYLCNNPMICATQETWIDL